ncbi:RluA family pseudouridine synthase [Aeromicrobium sp.]|nr:RluA family pseudouridine synthase [Candidatus Saccharibacteria bacterium]
MSNLELSRAKRLDVTVIEMYPEFSRGFASVLIEQGRVSVNGAVQDKAGYKMKFGDKVQVEYDASEVEPIPEIELPILYEDDDCVVVIKPVGLLTHSKGAFNPEPSVASWLRQRLASGAWQSTVDDAGNARAGIVHRLDRATSGVIICAKTPGALSKLQKQFSLRKAKKTYIAIVQGQLAQEHAVIDMPIERNPKKPQMFRVGINGKPSITEYKVTKTSEHYSMLELTPQTGRTHQLRVHLNQLGHPILGDEFYNGKKAARMFLHAYSLEITVPNSERLTFTAPLPPEFAKVLASDA